MRGWYAVDFILVTGVPGTGKTVIGSRLARRLGCGFTTLSWLVLEKGLWTSYDRERRSFVIDYDGLVEALRGLAEGPGCMVFDTHWLEPFAVVASRVVRVVVLRCNPLVLYERLSRRGWPRRKVVENVEAELVGVVAAEALELFGSVVAEVDTSGLSVEEAVAAVERLVRAGGSCCIDWLERLSGRELDELVKLIG